MTVLVGLVLAGCSPGEAEREEQAMAAALPDRVDRGQIVLTEADQQHLGLVVVAAEEGLLPDTFARFGSVVGTADTEAWVVAPVDGRLDGSRVSLGATVAGDDVLLTVSPSMTGGDPVAAAGLGDQIVAARAELTAADASMERARKLAPAEVVSAAQLQGAEAGAASARARLSGLERARRAWSRGEGGRMSLRAPIGGVVAEIAAVNGGPVRAGDVLARIVGPGARWIDLAVPPDDPVGQAFELDTPAGPVPASLVASGASVGADGARHDRLLVDAPLLPGSAVTVRVAIGESRGTLLPESAVARAAAGDLVWVEVATGRYRPRRVIVAERFGGRVRVEGVAPGERVVAAGAMALLGEALRGQLRHQE